MSSANIKSTALEKELSLKEGWENFLSQVAMRYGLLAMTVILIIFFSLQTKTFFSMLTLQSILNEKTPVALLALAATITMIVGKMNLNVGFGVTLWHVLAITLQQKYHFSWESSLVIVVLLGCLYGAFNGLLVAFADIDSFVATLGTGTVIYAISLWHTEGKQIVGSLPEGFYNLTGLHVFGLPIIVFYLITITIILWIIVDYTTIGRCMYAVGSNPVTAELNGIKVKLYYIGAYIASDGLIAFASVLIASHISIGSSNIGQDLLLPALVGAFLGSTTLKPGRVNIWGTIIGITLVSIGIAGLQQIGTKFFIEPLFNGSILLISITIAGYAQRRSNINKKNNVKIKSEHIKTATTE